MTFILSSCKTKIAEDHEKVVVTAFDKSLYMDEIESMLGPNMTHEDSFFFIKEFVNNWVQKQVILNYAQKSDLGNSVEIEKKIEDYRQDLTTFEYRKKMISEKLDTNITEGEIKAYYEQHQENFELKQNIIRFVFIKMPLDLENKNKFWNKFPKADNDALGKMAVLALKGGGNAFLGKDKWVVFDDILKVVPINTYNQENFINNNRVFKISESNFVWFINILEFRIKDSVSPLEFVKNNITEILLNKRKVDLMQKIESQLVKKAVKENDIKYFLPQYE